MPILAVGISLDSNQAEIESEAKTILELAVAELSKYNMTTKDIFLMHCYVKDMSQFSRFNAIYQKYFGLNPSPRVTIQVGLETNISIDFIACADSSKYTGIGMTKESLHVQGISYWAPANIGYLGIYIGHTVKPARSMILLYLPE